MQLLAAFEKVEVAELSVEYVLAKEEHVLAHERKADSQTFEALEFESLALLALSRMVLQYSCMLMPAGLALCCPL